MDTGAAGVVGLMWVIVEDSEATSEEPPEEILTDSPEVASEAVAQAPHEVAMGEGTMVKAVATEEASVEHPEAVVVEVVAMADMMVATRREGPHVVPMVALP